MISPIDSALSDFIDTLPEDWIDAVRLLQEAGPFKGYGELPELAEFAATLRGVPPLQPSVEWMAASKARIMAMVLPAPEPKVNPRWLSAAAEYLRQNLPSLPQLAATPSLFAKGAMALALIAAISSITYAERTIVPPGAKVQNAEQAITLAEQEVGQLPEESAAPESAVAGVYIKGTPKDVVLLSKYFSAAELAIDDAPASQQPELRAQLQNVVRAVRFDGTVDSVNGSTATISGVPVVLDPATARQLQTGQAVSLVVNVANGGKIQAAQVLTPTASSPPAAPPSTPAATSAPAPAASPPPPASSPNPTMSPSAGDSAGAGSTSDADGGAPDRADHRQRQAETDTNTDQSDLSSVVSAATAVPPARIQSKDNGAKNTHRGDSSAAGSGPVAPPTPAPPSAQTQAGGSGAGTGNGANATAKVNSGSAGVSVTANSVVVSVSSSRGEGSNANVSSGSASSAGSNSSSSAGSNSSGTGSSGPGSSSVANASSNGSGGNGSGASSGSGVTSTSSPAGGGSNSGGNHGKGNGNSGDHSQGNGGAHADSVRAELAPAFIQPPATPDHGHSQGPAKTLDLRPGKKN